MSQDTTQLQPETSSDGFQVVTNMKKLKRKSRQNGNDSDSDLDSKKAAASELQPVIVASQTEKPKKSYSPIFIDRAINKVIGKYEYCKPMQNGNTMVKCTNVN